MLYVIKHRNIHFKFSSLNCPIITMAELKLLIICLLLVIVIAQPSRRFLHHLLQIIVVVCHLKRIVCVLIKLIIQIVLRIIYRAYFVAKKRICRSLRHRSSVLRQTTCWSTVWPSSACILILGLIFLVRIDQMLIWIVHITAVVVVTYHSLVVLRMHIVAFSSTTWAIFNILNIAV